MTALLFGRPPLSAPVVVPVMMQALLAGVFAAPIRYLLWKLLERLEGPDAFRGSALDPGTVLP